MTTHETFKRTCDHCSADITGRPFLQLSGQQSFDPCTTFNPSLGPFDFCDTECHARWTSNTFGKKVTAHMWAAGGDFLATAEKPQHWFDSGWRRLAIQVFEVMWASRETSLGQQERETQPAAPPEDQINSI